MFENFTNQSIRAIMLAQEEARRLRHNWVGTDQILLGLIGEGTGIASKILQSKGISLKSARIAVEKRIGRGSDAVGPEVPFTASAKQLLNFSVHEAGVLGSVAIKTEHLLLGLTDTEGDFARDVLNTFGISLSEIRGLVFSTIGATDSNQKRTIVVSLSPQKQQSSFPLKIFLAHANEDKADILRLHSRLKAQGYQPWVDKLDLIPGQNWRSQIPKIIRASDVFIACLSKQSVSKGGYIQKEFRLALNYYAERPHDTVYVIPLRLDECEIPDLRQEDYGINLRDIHWVDYWQEDGFNDLARALEYVARSKQ